MIAPLFVAVLVLAPAARARGGEDGRTALAPWSWTKTSEHVVIARALRESRGVDEAAGTKLVERIVDAGPSALDAGIDILARRRVPEVGPDDRPQILSEPQRELLLTALSQQPVARVRAALESRLAANGKDAGTRLAAIQVLGVIGSAADLDRMIDLAPHGAGEEKAFGEDARNAERSACASILRRDRRAWSTLAKLFHRVEPGAVRPLLEALTSMKDPRALAVLQAAASTGPELRVLAVALVAGCGRSLDAPLNEQFAGWMVSELSSAQPEYARSLVRAIGVLDDGSCVPTLIDRLEDENSGVREAALIALRRVSGLGLPADASTWRAWHTEEVRWHTECRPTLLLDLASHDPQRIVAALRSYSDRRTKTAELAGDVVRVLSDSRPELRRLACDVLQALGSSSACDALAELLQDPDASVAQAAWTALRAITGLDLPRDPQRAREMLPPT